MSLVRSTIAALVVLLCATTASAEGTITVAWDPSPDPAVRGYFVLVGQTPGVASRQVDVGGALAFTLTDAHPGVRYYFRVASYGADGIPGPPSLEVSDIAGTAPAAGGPAPPTGAETAAASASLPRSVCPARTDCYTIEPLATHPSRIVSLDSLDSTSVAFANANGDLFAVDASQRRVTPLAGSSGDGWRTGSVAAHPAFSTTGFIYTADFLPAADNQSSEVRVMRHRIVGASAGERAMLIDGLPGGTAPPVLTAEVPGYLFLALAAGPAPGVAPADGLVLRFTDEGGVPADNRAMSPVFGYGYDAPTDFAESPGQGTLLLAGADVDSSSGVLRIASTVVRPATARGMFMRGGDGVLVRAVPAANRAVTLQRIALAAGIEVTAVAQRGNTAFVALQDANGTAMLVRLTPTAR